MIQTIAIDQLHPHPDNANVMSAKLLDMLVEHMRRSQRYPPLIVRPHQGNFQILDGHHRAEALKRLGVTSATCQVWPADDHEADLLLLTLNRLRGEDDPAARGALLDRAADRLGLKNLHTLIPDDRNRLKKLIALHHAPPDPVPAISSDSLPEAITFFLTSAQRGQLIDRLKLVASNRNEALVEILELNSP